LITVVCGGVGAAKFLSGLLQVVPAAEVTAIVNTGDDTDLHGLRVCPDLDTVMYTLAGAVDAHRGWGLSGETWAAMEALERYGGATWFRLGDRDLATHLYRTGRLAAGATLSEVTRDLASSWGLRLALLPMSDDPVRTRLRLAGGGPRPGEEVAFQEYFVRLGHSVAVEAVRFEGIERAAPAPGVLEAIAGAGTVVIAPSNPVVSIAPVVSVPGVEAALRARREHVVAVSPIVGGAALKGSADRMMRELGEEPTAAGVARWHRAYAGALVIDRQDADLAPEVRAAGMRCVVTDTVMSTPAVAAELARAVLRAGGEAAG
jgi:LPPG:FO 2-phospho-L-lactate transferase